MIISVYVDGLKEATSAKGNQYGDLYCRGVSGDGTPEFEQLKFRTFNSDVLAKLRKVNKDQLVELDLQIRDATIEGII